MSRAVLYARVSTDAQQKEATIESQLFELKRQIAAAGDVLIKEYIDDGYSGTLLRDVGASADLERCALRPGNVQSADSWDGVLKPVVARYQGKVSRIYFRAVAFAMPEVYEFLEAERIKYAIRLPANQILQHRIGYLLKRPVGRPSNDVRRFHANFIYQAGMASRRALSARRLHRHQPVAPGRPGRRLLQ
jgi:hypothetical protein